MYMKHILKMRGTSHFSIILGFILIITQISHCYGQLKAGFYDGKCGQNAIEKVIHDVVKQKITNDPDIVSDLLRLSFHDCFVRGCDGSILLNGENAEKKASINLVLGGFDDVDHIKDVVEKACPGVVSCADILVMATRSAVSLAGGYWYDVETGRRDGLVSFTSDPPLNIPSERTPVTQAIAMFAKKGLNKTDFVVLLGSHTVGTSHCRAFKDRLYNFHNTQKPDSRISPTLLDVLRNTCPLDNQFDNETFLDQTWDSHFKFDNAYYKQILANNGVTEIDQNIALNSLTRDQVNNLANNSNQFLSQFGPAMVNMARIGVLTGTQGEIRKYCGSRN